MFGVGWLYLFVAGIQSYQGSVIVYIAFSVAFLMLLVSAFHNQRTYVYTYLVLFLWLGYWLKVSYHLAFSHPYVEPTGQFVGSAASWDKVLLISTVAAIGVLISRTIFQRMSGNKQSVLGCKRYIPHWLGTCSSWHLVSFLLVLIATAVANIYFGIFIVGFDVKTILMWPLNALITLMLVGGGFVVWAASILWWRLDSGRPMFIPLVILVTSGAVITFSTLSRGLIVFFVLPLLYAVYINRQKVADYSMLKLGLIGLFFIVTTISSFFFINTIRDNVYIDKNNESARIEAKPSSMPSSMPSSVKVRAFLNFSVDRWVGVEGVMAVSSYPEIGSDLLLRAILEKPTTDKPSIYQIICPWPSSPQFNTLKKNVSLFSLPGGIAFLYYSGSIIIVFVSIVLISVLLQYTESVIFSFTGNPILCSGVGWLMAITFAHFGGAPRYVIPVFVFLFISICFIGVIQSKRTEYFFSTVTPVRSGRDYYK